MSIKHRVFSEGESMGGHSRQQDPGKDRGREKSRVVECGEQDTGAGETQC